uniref:Uncharacterized protein n=1 Tax=Siphoviridae sp. ctPAi1 TaxID=2826320 RepID=A0A8S5M7S2_9CAUD|nr:MAG TPA: hypothetical protein [Siphoviridae sp. ctPAi1]
MYLFACYSVIILISYEISVSPDARRVTPR